MLHLRVLALAVLAWLAMFASGPIFVPAAYAQATGDPSFALVNRSGRTINAAFASLSTETNWGQDRLGANVVLPNGQRFQLSLPQGPCQWDVAVVYDDGRREEKRNQNLCAVAEVAFDASQARVVAPAPNQQGGQPAAPAPQAGNTGDPSFALVNRSGRTIVEAFASLATAQGWGTDRLGANVVLAAGQRFQMSLPQGPCLWNLAVIYDDGRREEKRNQNLCTVTELAFDASQARAVGPAPNQQGGQQPSPAPSAAGTGDPSFALVNRSGRTIALAYVSLVNTPGWGEDRLGNAMVGNGQRFQINLPAGPCRWSVAVVFDDGRREEKRNVDLCAIAELAFDGSQARASAPNQPQPPTQGQRGPSYGSGFFISAQGHMLTNAHVVDGCRTIQVNMDGARAVASLVRKDEANDLALLRVELRQEPPFARFRGGPTIRPGDDVVVAGFPLPTVLQNGLNITTGNVSAMAGLGGNTALIQITAPVQPGNSGGPLLDMSGNVVGVIVSKLDAQRIARVTGDIPQNVNFAVQGAVARIFIEAGGQRATEAPSTRDMRAADVGEQSRNYTFQIECR
jgi:S1-C subfamily serine protease